jgi:hypothetical protein
MFMEPLNKSSRKKAFTNFLIFFIVTEVLVISAVFFSIQVPFEKNRQLTEQMKVVEAERLFTQKFESNMNQAMKLVNDLNKKELDITITDGKLEERIKSMNALIETDSSYAADPNSATIKELYSSVVESLSNLRIAKKDNREAAGIDANISELKQEIASLKSELNNAKQTINVREMQLAAASRSN